MTPPDWFEAASEAVAEFRKQTKTRADLKRFYAGDGPKQAALMISQLDRLRIAVQPFIRA